MSPDEKAKVLIVDDLAENILSYQAILEELGQELVVARSGDEALKEVLRHDFAVILLDVNMPLLDGERFMQIFQARNIHLPVLIMSANQETRRWAEAHGAVGFVAKPFDLPVLLSSIKRAVKR